MTKHQSLLLRRQCFVWGKNVPCYLIFQIFQWKISLWIYRLKAIWPSKMKWFCRKAPKVVWPFCVSYCNRQSLNCKDWECVTLLITFEGGRELRETGITSYVCPDTRATSSCAEGVNPICEDWSLEQTKPLCFSSCLWQFLDYKQMKSSSLLWKSLLWEVAYFSGLSDRWLPVHTYVGHYHIWSCH